MSRYDLEPRPDAVAAHGNLCIAIGWDAPLDTFFAMVLRDDDDVPDEARDLVWVGTRYGEVAEADNATDAIRAFAAILEGLAATLCADRSKEGSRPRSPWIR
ncbi:hypothetical protein KRZ98_16830 [Sphingobium sp. AS12]|nr:hypothetical protein [Sphingobium sp. AS12]